MRKKLYINREAKIKKVNTNIHKKQQKKLSSLKNMYFNRYLMVRYFLAVFVFSNSTGRCTHRGNGLWRFPVQCCYWQ